MGLKQDFVAAIGEFTGTTLFLLLALGGAKTAQFTLTSAQTDGLQTSLNSQTIIFIAVSFGLSLLVTAWVFYRVTGGLFNPAITLALYLIGGLTAHRAVILTISQMLGGIAGSALVAALTPFGGVESVMTKLDPRVNRAQGVFLEAFLTAILVLTVLLLAAEKHKATHLAPIGIGLVLLACHMFGVVWTGCGINPARALGPSVISGSFPTYHWIYWLGPFIGSLMAVAFYLMLKAFDYTSVVFDQDADHEDVANKRHVVGSNLFKRARGKVVVYHAKAGQKVGDPVPVKAFDEKDEAMQEAIRNGHASVIDTSDVQNGSQNLSSGGDVIGALEHGYANGGAPPLRPKAASRQNSIGPSMHSSAQDLGAMQSPGSSNTGLANIPGARKFLSS